MEWNEILNIGLQAGLVSVGGWILKTLMKMEKKMAVQDNVNETVQDKLSAHDELLAAHSESLSRGSEVLKQHTLRIHNHDVDIKALNDQLNK